MSDLYRAGFERDKGQTANWRFFRRNRSPRRPIVPGRRGLTPPPAVRDVTAHVSA
jgi:hypothetical protein